MQSGVSSYFQILSLTHVMSLLPDRLYPGIQSTSTLVPWFTGREILVFRLKISGSPVHLSEIMHCIIMTVDSLFYFYLFENKFNVVLPKSNPAFDSCETEMNNNVQKDLFLFGISSLHVRHKTSSSALTQTGPKTITHKNFPACEHGGMKFLIP